MKSFNLAILTQQERDDIALEKKAAMLIKKQKLGKLSHDQIKGILADEKNPETKAKLRGYLNKYRKMQ